MKGRKPKPTATQIAAGDPRKLGKRKLQAKLESEPAATRGLPECPEHLQGRARAAWEFWAKELELMNLDSRPDAQMLEGACVNYARAVDADLMVTRDGITVEESTIDEDSGEKIVLKIRAHPAVAVSNQSWRLLRAFASEFGLAPVPRTRLTIEKPDNAEKDLADILSRPREPRQITTVN